MNARGAPTSPIARYRSRAAALFRPRIFVLSVQRTGTTSVGQFFADHGHATATWGKSKRAGWTEHWFNGDYERIFRSTAFQTHNVFEDAPWYCGDFYRYLFHRFRNARFVLIERDADRWFDSMVSHSNGRTLGNTHRHAALYHRLSEYYREIGLHHPHAFSGNIDGLLAIGEDQRDHYVDWYRNRNASVREFFQRFAPDRLFDGALEDPSLWMKLGASFNLDVSPSYNVRANASKPR